MSGQETWQRLQQQLQRAQEQGRRFGGGGGGGPSPRGALTGIGSLILLGGGAILLNNSLFNVDGGHRAIKYTRIGGVSKEIYNEGTDALSRRSSS